MMMSGYCVLCLWEGCDLGEWGLELYLSVFYRINQNVLFQLGIEQMKSVQNVLPE